MGPFSESDHMFTFSAIGLVTYLYEMNVKPMEQVRLSQAA